MELRLYNTMARQIQPFQSLDGKSVRMYCCGPTVYSFAHIGNLRTYIFEDILRRSLQMAGYDLTHVMNVTDVAHLTGDGDDGEDKMIKAARERGMNVWDIAAHYTKVFFEDCAKLRIARPEVVCTATEHIQDMINLIQKLESLGLTYIANGNVYYDVSKFKYYSELGQLDKQELRAGTSVAIDEGKRNPTDFVLWFTNSKFKGQAMIWDSPWGRGYPGWHIECSAMSHKYLGEQFDIHCGGVDHIKVHHTNEIAQTEGATGKHPWVKYWMHGEFLILNNAKMSKSSGDFLTLTRLGELGFDPLDYRYFCLGAHYRTQLNFNDDSIAAARSARANLLDKLKALVIQAEAATAGNGRKQTGAAFALAKIRVDQAAVKGEFRVAAVSEQSIVSGQWDGGGSLDGESLRLFQGFLAMVADDLNMPRALAMVFETLKSNLSAAQKLRVINFMDQVLGLDLLARVEQRLLDEASQYPAGGAFSDAESTEIQALIDERLAARKAKNFARGDEIRDQLKSRGIILVDTPAGTTFHRV